MKIHQKCGNARFSDELKDAGGLVGSQMERFGCDDCSGGGGGGGDSNIPR